VSAAPTFSVLMAAHRADAHLQEALHSVLLALDGHAAELIVVANGADRQAVAQAVSQAMQSHAGTAATRVELSALPSLAYCLNRALELARGEFVARFDADDVCLHDRFTVQLALARGSAADFVFGAARDIDACGAPTGRVRLSNTWLWNRCGPVHPTAFARRSSLLALGGYGQLDASEDYHLWLRARAAGCRLHADAEPVIAYRVHAQQATTVQRLADTFATNAGIKLTQALRQGSPALLAGAALDLARYCYRRCANAFL